MEIPKFNAPSKKTLRKRYSINQGFYNYKIQKVDEEEVPNQVDWKKIARQTPPDPNYWPSPRDMVDSSVPGFKHVNTPQKRKKIFKKLLSDKPEKPKKPRKKRGKLGRAINYRSHLDPLGHKGFYLFNQLIRGKGINGGIFCSWFYSHYLVERKKDNRRKWACVFFYYQKDVKRFLKYRYYEGSRKECVKFADKPEVLICFYEWVMEMIKLKAITDIDRFQMQQDVVIGSKEENIMEGRVNKNGVS